MQYRTMPRRRISSALLLALVALLLAAGCSGDDGGGDDAADTVQQGGAEDQPGALPDGVEFDPDPLEGVPAPDFTTELLDGTPVTASDLWADRPVVLMFTASWCETCADVHTELAEVVDGYDGAVTMLGVVNEDDAEAAREYANELALGYPIAVAGPDTWLDYAAREPPLVALVAPGGAVVSIGQIRP
jgi:thiol-disulfide isomerase/thioredoxin